MSWTEQNVKMLRTLWSEGLSCSQIADRLACGLSRNAVIGKLHRLGLAKNAGPAAAPRPAAPRPAAAAQRAKRAPKPRIARVRPPIEARPARAWTPPALPKEITPPDSAMQCTIVSLAHDACRWPVGDPAYLETFRYCGSDARPGGPYCAFHHAVAYEPASKRKRHDDAVKRGIFPSRRRMRDDEAPALAGGVA